MFAPGPDDIAWLLLLFVVVPLAWLIGLIWIGSRPKSLVIWTVLIGAFYVAFGLASHTGAYTLTVQILDPDRHPLPGVTATYFTRPQSDRFGRFSRSLEGEATTDAAGQIALNPNHAHGVNLTIRDPRFRNAGFQMEAAGRRYGHQILPDQSVTFIEPQEPPPATGAFHGSWVIDAQPEQRIVIALKSK